MLIIRRNGDTWTVGYLEPEVNDGFVWTPLMDFGDIKEAMHLVHYLNGGDNLRFMGEP